jgi:hypothetical protein
MFGVLDLSKYSTFGFHAQFQFSCHLKLKKKRSPQETLYNTRQLKWTATKTLRWMSGTTTHQLTATTND